MPTALITGASRGYGRALSQSLAEQGWAVVIDGRDPATLEQAARDLRARAPQTPLRAIAGDVTDAAHRAALRRAVEELGGLDLLVNNAGALGPSPLPQLADLDPRELRAVLETNLVAPLTLVQELLPTLHRPGGTIVNLTSDAAVEAYAGWGAYGTSKAALDHLGAILAVEHTDLRVLAFDPGDLRTDMHQAAFPGEDISERPAAEEAVPPLLDLLGSGALSGRYRSSELTIPVGGLLRARRRRRQGPGPTEWPWTIPPSQTSPSGPTSTRPRHPRRAVSHATRCGCWSTIRPRGRGR